MHMYLASKADDAIPSHLRGLAKTSDSRSHDSRPVDEEGGGVHDQHALTPPDGNGVGHVHRSARDQSRPARRASARAAHGQTPRHLQLERRRDCGQVTGLIMIMNDWDVEEYQHCTHIPALAVRARPCSCARLIAPAAVRIAPSRPCR